MRPEMAARPLHLFEAGVVTEQQFVGLGEAPAVLAPLLFPGSRRIAEERVALVGARMLDGGEALNLDRSRVLRIAFDEEHPEAPGLVAWARRRSVWLHVDIDVVNPREFPAVAFAAIGGPSLSAPGGLL